MLDLLLSGVPLIQLAINIYVHFIRKPKKR